MTIEIIDGCLLDAFDRGDVDIIGHCCNMQNNFGSGIAKSIRERYPKAYYVDSSHYSLPEHNKRSWSSAGIPDPNSPLRYREIYNLYGQKYYGGYGEHYKRFGHNLDYGKLAEAMVRMSDRSSTEWVIGFPYLIGCDRAKGDWNVVIQIIEHIFKYHQVKIYKL